MRIPSKKGDMLLEPASFCLSICQPSSTLLPDEELWMLLVFASELGYCWGMGLLSPELLRVCVFWSQTSCDLVPLHQKLNPFLAISAGKGETARPLPSSSASFQLKPNGVWCLSQHEFSGCAILYCLPAGLCCTQSSIEGEWSLPGAGAHLCP